MKTVAKKEDGRWELEAGRFEWEAARRKKKLPSYQ